MWDVQGKVDKHKKFDWHFVFTKVATSLYDELNIESKITKTWQKIFLRLKHVTKTKQKYIN